MPDRRRKAIMGISEKWARYAKLGDSTLIALLFAGFGY